MTDRAKGCWVSFDQDYRVDDIEATLNAIRNIKGVVAVEARIVCNADDWMMRQRVKSEIRQKVHDLWESL